MSAGRISASGEQIELFRKTDQFGDTITADDALTTLVVSILSSNDEDMEAVALEPLDALQLGTVLTTWARGRLR